MKSSWKILSNILSEDWFWLGWLLLFTFILRMPSLWEPYWYGDEGITMLMGRIWREGGVFYRDLHDNKPPILYFIAGISGNLIVWKLLLMGWMLFSVNLFWKLAGFCWNLSYVMNSKSEHLVGKMRFVLEKVRSVSNSNLSDRWLFMFLSGAIFVCLTSTPWWEGNIANGEIFMLAPILLGYLCFINYISNRKFVLMHLVLDRNIWLGLGACFYSVAFLIKIPALFDFFSGLFFLFVLEYKNKSVFVLNMNLVKNLIEKLLYVGLGFIFPVGLMVIYFAVFGALRQFIQAVFINNYLYVGFWDPVTAWGTKGSFGGELWQRFVILFIWLSVILVLRSKLSKTAILLAVWLGWSLFGATLSGRPYPDYLLQIAPVVSLIIVWLLLMSKKYWVIFWNNIVENKLLIIKQIRLFSFSKLMRNINIDFAVLLVSLLLVYLSWLRLGYWEYDVQAYYVNFYSYLVGNQSYDDYRNYFGNDVNNIYKLSAWLKANSNVNDKIFYYGEKPQVLVLADRIPASNFAFAHHILGFNAADDVLEDLSMSLPKFILDDINVPQIEGMKELLINNYSYIFHIGSVSIYKLN